MNSTDRERPRLRAKIAFSIAKATIAEVKNRYRFSKSTPSREIFYITYNVYHRIYKQPLQIDRFHRIHMDLGVAGLLARRLQQGKRQQPLV